MSVLGGIARWSNVLGPIAAGVLSDAAGLRFAFLAVVPMSAVCAGLVWHSPLIAARDVEARRVRQASNATAEADDHSLPGMLRALRLHGHLIARVGVFSLNLVSLQQCRRLMLTIAALNFGMSNSAVGLTLAVGFSIDASLFFLGGYITDHYGIKFSAVPTTVNMGLAFLVLPLATTVPRLVAIGVLFGLAGSLGSGLLLTLMANSAPKEAGPPFLGMMRTVQDAGLLVGPLLAAAFIHTASFATACNVLGCIGLVNGLWALALLPADTAHLASRALAALPAIDVVQASDADLEPLQPADGREPRGEKADGSL